MQPAVDSEQASTKIYFTTARHAVSRNPEETYPEMMKI